MNCVSSKDVARPVFQGWENYPGGIVIRVTLVESVIHTICCHTQMVATHGNFSAVLYVCYIILVAIYIATKMI